MAGTSLFLRSLVNLMNLDTAYPQLLQGTVAVRSEGLQLPDLGQKIGAERHSWMRSPRLRTGPPGDYCSGCEAGAACTLTVTPVCVCTPPTEITTGCAPAERLAGMVRLTCITP